MLNKYLMIEEGGNIDIQKREKFTLILISIHGVRTGNTGAWEEFWSCGGEARKHSGKNYKRVPGVTLQVRIEWFGVPRRERSFLPGLWAGNPENQPVF